MGVKIEILHVIPDWTQKPWLETEISILDISVTYQSHVNYWDENLDFAGFVFGVLSFIIIFPN